MKFGFWTILGIRGRAGDIEQHLYTLRGIGFPVSKLASEGYVIFHNRFQYGRI